MADIEERARQFIRDEYLQNPDSDGEIYSANDMINAYLAGSAQTQQDYAAHVSRLAFCGPDCPGHTTGKPGRSCLSTTT